MLVGEQNIDGSRLYGLFAWNSCKKLFYVKPQESTYILMDFHAWRWNRASFDSKEMIECLHI
jgi:hypothetical protein